MPFAAETEANFKTNRLEISPQQLHQAPPYQTVFALLKSDGNNPVSAHSFVETATNESNTRMISAKTPNFNQQ